MTLNGALNVGRTALSVSQVAMEVAGNNMANAATESFNRRTVHLAPIAGEPIGRNQFIGRGVDLVAIRREVDLALQARLRDAIAQEHGALVDQRYLSSLEAIQGELTEQDLSTLLSSFFNAFSELANNPEDNAFRTVVVEEGRRVAGRVADMGRDLLALRGEVEQALSDSVTRVNDVLEAIADLNLKIAQAEAGVGSENALRDRRDALLGELATYFEVTTIEQPSGAVNVLVGSIPVVLGSESRGVELRQEPQGETVELSLRVAVDGTPLSVESGRLGALMRQRTDALQPSIDALDTFAAQLIFQVNRVHSQGQGRHGFTAVQGTYAIEDTTANLNAAASGLPFRIENGSFFIHVTHAASGLRTTHEIAVNGDAHSLEDLIDRINLTVGVPNTTAAAGPGNRFALTAAGGYEISFSDDSSGALAALGVNTFFSGEAAGDIDVNEVLRDDPDLLAAASGHVPGSNGTALAIASLQDRAVDALAGASLRGYWENEISRVAARSHAASQSVESAVLVRESLFAQNQNVSGVSLDDEAINLLTYQRQFQAAARFIAVIDEALQTLLSLV